MRLPGPGRSGITLQDLPAPAHEAFTAYLAARSAVVSLWDTPEELEMATTLPANPEAIFTYGAPQLKFGPGAADEIGFDLSQLGVRRVLLVTDRGIAETGVPQRIADQIAKAGIEARVFDGVRIEPTDASLETAIGYARDAGPWDAFVAVGGGSTIDTTKAVNLMLTNPGELMD